MQFPAFFHFWQNAIKLAAKRRKSQKQLSAVKSAETRQKNDKHFLECSSGIYELRTF